MLNDETRNYLPDIIKDYKEKFPEEKFSINLILNYIAVMRKDEEIDGANAEENLATATLLADEIHHETAFINFTQYQLLLEKIQTPQSILNALEAQFALERPNDDFDEKLNQAYSNIMKFEKGKSMNGDDFGLLTNLTTESDPEILTMLQKALFLSSAPLDQDKADKRKQRLLDL